MTIGATYFRATFGFCGLLFAFSACKTNSIQRKSISQTHGALRYSEAFFNLHQATGFLEAYQGRRCSSGLKKAVGYLQNARAALAKSPDDHLIQIADQLSPLISSGEPVQIVQIERIRERLHSLALERGS